MHHRTTPPKSLKAITAGIVLSVLVICPVLRGDDVLRRVSEEEAKKALTTKIAPEYPPMARQMKLGGKVQVDAFIDVEGNVEKVTIITGNPLLTSAAVNAVKRWKFTPFMVEGKPTRAVAGFSFSFSP